MRRAFSAACALVALVLAGCGGGGSTPTTVPQAVPNGHYGHPTKIQHSAGETFVPGRARKVIALTPGAIDTTLALGVKPIGAATTGGGRLPRYLARRAPGVELVGSMDRPDLNRIRALKSELILGSKQRQGRLFAQLQLIAPTVLGPPPRIGPGTPRVWKLFTRLYAESLGRVDEGEALLTRYDGLAARARRALGPRAHRLRVAALEALPGSSVRLAGLDSFAAAVLEDAGLRGPRPRGIYQQLLPGRYSRLQADVVLVSAPSGGGATLSRLRRALHARVVVVPDDIWWQGEGPLASAEALRELQRALRRPG